MKLYYLTCFATSLLCTTAWGQTTAEKIEENLAIYHLNYPQEKVYLHHDKPQYVLGEDIWYKAYLVDAIFHQPLTPSQQIRVELLDPSDEMLVQQTVRIEDGGAPGQISIDPNWLAGEYLLRAYTTYQRNFEESMMFKKKIAVLDAYSSVRNPDFTSADILENTQSPVELTSRQRDQNVMFYPEGGELVVGVTSTVGVNVYNAEGEGRVVSANVYNRGGDVVARFRTHETGLGFFNITPEAGEIYTAEVTWGEESLKISLPSASTSGYVLRVTERRDTLTISAATNISGGLNGAFIVGHQRGSLFGTINGLQGERQVMRVPLAETPDGIIHFTLFKQDGIPVSERLVCAYRPELHDLIDLEVAQENFDRRGQVLISINAPDSIVLNGSLAVSDLQYGTPPEYASNIESYLLLESDLRGVIPDPGFFFGGSGAGNKLRDILMLTHGWRRFDWRSLINDPNVELTYSPENALDVRGYITKLGNPRKRVKSKVLFSTLSSNFNMQEFITDDEGAFAFSGFEFFEPSQVLLQAEIYKEKKNADVNQVGLTGDRWVDIYLDQSVLPLIERADAIEPQYPDDQVLLDYFEESRKIQTVDSAYTDLISVTLEEVVIEEEAYDPVTDFHKSMMIYSEPTSRLIMDSVITQGSLSRSVFDYMRGRVPGVEIIGSYPNQTARIRGINSINLETTAGIMVDGMFVEPYVANSIPIDQIAFIDVIRGLSAAAVFGEQGNGGIIAIYRKSPKQRLQSTVAKGTLSFVHPGYHKPPTFFSPDYGETPSRAQPDFRTTLYWEPDASLDGTGKKYITFYASDKSGVYSVRLEGITTSGTPVALRSTFEVR